MAESAGLILYRIEHGRLEVLIGHPGGPIWANRDEGAWSIPKGLVKKGEDHLEAALREFAEETGFTIPTGDPIHLGTVTQRAGKRVTAWALQGSAEPGELTSNPVVMKWPPRLGASISFPELDRVMWASVEQAAAKLNPAQMTLVARLEETLEPDSPGGGAGLDWP